MTAARSPEPLERRTYSRLRRHSRRADRGYVRPLSWPQAHRQKAILRAFRATTARRGRREGSVRDGHVCLSAFDDAVYAFLCEFAASCAGRVEPSLKYIAFKLTGLDTRTKRVCQSLRRLADGGWIEWDRRYEEVDGRRGVRGPQVEQTTNLYRVLDPPAKAVALVAAGLARRRAPPPEDVAWAADQREAERAAHAELRRRRQLQRGSGRAEPTPGHGYATPGDLAAAVRAEAAARGELAPEPPPDLTNVIPLRGQNPGSESDRRGER